MILMLILMELKKFTNFSREKTVKDYNVHFQKAVRSMKFLQRAK